MSDTPINQSRFNSITILSSTNIPNKMRKTVCFSGKSPSQEREPGTNRLPPDANHHTVDFDGTIFMQDTGHVLVDNLGCGSKHRQLIEEQIKSGQRSFREASEEMWGSLRIPFESGFEVMEKQLEMDEGFQDFHRFCVDKGIDFNIISAGLKPVLRKVLDTFLGETEVRSLISFSCLP